jgi:hypothetical protein
MAVKLECMLASACALDEGLSYDQGQGRPPFARMTSGRVGLGTPRAFDGTVLAVHAGVKGPACRPFGG